MILDINLLRLISVGRGDIRFLNNRNLAYDR